jgi:UDP-galactopyranose mutase
VQLNQRNPDNRRISIDVEMDSSHEKKWMQKRLMTQLKISYSDEIGKYLQLDQIQMQWRSLKCISSYRMVSL